MKTSKAHKLLQTTREHGDVKVRDIEAMKRHARALLWAEMARARDERAKSARRAERARVIRVFSIVSSIVLAAAATALCFDLGAAS